MRFTGKTSFYRPDSRTKSLMVFTALSFAGVIIGSVISCMGYDEESLLRLMITQNIIKGQISLSFLRQFLRTLIPIAVILIIQFFSGYFAFGQPFAAITVIARGAASGISAALTYLELGIKGLFSVLGTILPLSLMSMAVIVLGAREASDMAWKIAGFAFLKDDAALPDRKLYLIKFAVLLILALIVSLIDTAVFHIFGGAA